MVVLDKEQLGIMIMRITMKATIMRLIQLQQLDVENKLEVTKTFGFSIFCLNVLHFYGK